MSTAEASLPDWLHRQIRMLSERDEISVEQSLATAPAEKLSSLQTKEYLAERAGRIALVLQYAAVPGVAPRP